MTSLARYHGRSPRYILDTEDESLIRVAGPKQTPWEESTSIKNVSLTGLAFFAPEDLCPLLGEVIKIQFTPPGSKQMACYGIVTRLENSEVGRTLVGVHFYKMDMNQRIVLAQGLAKKFKENQDRQDVDSMMDTKRSLISLRNTPQLFFMSLLAVFWCTITWYLFHFQYAGFYTKFLNFLNLF